jgi:hypothetical protein
MLKTMQLMQYFVNSSFGMADTPSFEGTPLALLMGLGQGSGAAPMGMRGVVTLVVNSYKTLGHGMTATMSQSQCAVLLAAIIYVDDTDILHWGEFYGISDTAFLSRIQRVPPFLCINHTLTTSFLDYIYSLRNQSLWDYLEIDDG